MNRNIDVKTEMRKLTSSKPVHAVTGAGVLASRTLMDLPGRLARWGNENPVTSLPSRANGYVHTAQARANGYVHTAQARASEYVRTARAKAADGYDTLAARGKKALNGAPRTAQAKSTQASSATAKSTQAKSGAATQGKTAPNGNAKGKTTSRSTTSH